MRGKPVVLRALARSDIEAAVDFYAAEAGPAVATRFVAALRAALSAVAARPAAGSPRLGVELELPGLRTWAVRRFPFLIFYIDRDEHVDVWRVLHGGRDIPELMRGPET